VARRKICVRHNFPTAPLLSGEIKSHSLPRVCLLTETYYPLTGGGESQTRTLAKNLLARKFPVIIITRRCSESLKEIDSVDGVAVYRISPVGAGRFTRWHMLFWSFLALARLRRQYDLVFVSGFKALGLSAVLAAKLFRKTCILKADSNGEMSGEFFAAGLKKMGLTPSFVLVRVLLAGRNRILRTADYFVAITRGITEELKARGVSPRSIVSIANTVDTLKFRPVGAFERSRLRQKLAIPNKRVIITYTGRLVSYKGLPLLLRVAETMQSTFPEVGFVLVGSGGLDMHNCEADLKLFVKAKGLEETVCFAGETGNVHEYLQVSDIFVLPSEDAFPLALVEAMACGLPIVATRVGGIPEIVSDKENGLLVEPRNFHQLYEAIAALVADNGLSHSLGNLAKHTVRERYSAAAVSAQYVELFRNAVAHKTSGI
jgi:glycosyltransferase involved in cell wall biosynthesis